MEFCILIIFTLRHRFSADGFEAYILKFWLIEKEKLHQQVNTSISQNIEAMYSAQCLCR